MIIFDFYASEKERSLGVISEFNENYMSLPTHIYLFQVWINLVLRILQVVACSFLFDHSQQNKRDKLFYRATRTL